MALQYLLPFLALSVVHGAQRSLLQNSQYSNPATITVSSDPYDVIATPITPQLPYSQAAYQCNVSGDSRIPGLATYPLTVQVPQGKFVKVVFANGYLSTDGSSSGSGSSSSVVDTTGLNLAGSTVVSGGRKLLQDTVEGGPNNGLVEYVSYSSSNSVSGFTVSSTEYGVTDLQYSASGANAGQTATFKGVLQVAQVSGGQPIVPFVPNSRLSPECQVNVNFVTV